MIRWRRFWRWSLWSPLSPVETVSDLGHTDAGDTACLLTDRSLVWCDGTLWYISTVMDALFHIMSVWKCDTVVSFQFLTAKLVRLWYCLFSSNQCVWNDHQRVPPWFWMWSRCGWRLVSALCTCQHQLLPMTFQFLSVKCGSPNKQTNNVFWSPGDGCVDKPLSTLWRNHISSEKADILMKVSRTRQ